MSPKWLFMLAAPWLLAIACGGAAGPTATPSPTAEVQTPTASPTPTLTAEPTPAVEFGPLSQEAPVEGTFVIDLAAGRWFRVIPTFSTDFVALSPDGETIVYRTQDGLVAAGVDGSNPRQIADGQRLQAAFSPDGKVLAIWGFEAEPPLTLISWPDGQPVEVDVPASVGYAAWSATTLAACTGEGIYFISPDGITPAGSQPELCHEGRIYGAALPPFTWAPHAPRLAFWTSGQEGSILLTVAPREEPRVLAQLPGERVRGVSWSPDGSLLAVVVIRPAPPPPDPPFGLLDIRVIDAASGQTRFTITGAGAAAMAWSPVESLLLFDTLCSSDEQLMLVDGDGSNLRPLSELQQGLPLGHAWSPDGREVATGWVERNAVTAIDVESGESRTLIRGPGVYDIHWVTADRLVVTTIPGTGFCEDVVGQTTSVVFP